MPRFRIMDDVSVPRGIWEGEDGPAALDAWARSEGHANLAELRKARRWDEADVMLFAREIDERGEPVPGGRRYTSAPHQGRSPPTIDVSDL